MCFFFLLPIDSIDSNTRPLLHTVTMAPALKICSSKWPQELKGEKKTERSYQRGKSVGGGSTLYLCSKCNTYVITASSAGHFFQESGLAGFYLKLLSFITGDNS